MQTFKRFSCQFYRKWVSVSKEYKILLESVRNNKLHFVIETVVDCRKYHLHNCKKRLPPA